MNKNRSGWITGMVLAAFLVAFIPSSKISPIAAPIRLQGGQRVIVDTVQSDEIAGGQTLADYGELQLIELPPGAPVPEGARPIEDVIHLRGFDLKTQQPAIMNLSPQLLQNNAPEGKGFWMVQFAGPIQDEWLNRLRNQGLEIVAYMPENAYVVWGDQPDRKSAQAALDNPLLTWQGAYQPAYRLDPNTRALAAEPQGSFSAEVTVQIYRTKQTADTIARLSAMAEAVLEPAAVVLQYTNLSLRLPTARLVEVASLPDVFDVETYAKPVMLDEAQGQIVAGNLTTSLGNVVPSGPGYLTWLASKGFPTTPNSYPIVDVYDDGIDVGYPDSVIHPDFYELGDPNQADRVAYLLNCTIDLLPDGLAGHGNINAGIIGGYNNKTGSSFEDGSGYNYGLGISPFGRLAGTKIFNNFGSSDLSGCLTEANAVYTSYIKGARITNNSWGYDDSNLYGAYTAVSQAYDVLTRDAVDDISGYQSMLHVFSAGNRGSSSTTVLPPATAKNVLAVGATENVRGQGVVDGCGVNYANNADDIASFSSRGPTSDQRVKPDIMAPGTHVQGPASQDPGYTGDGVCNLYYPIGQTLYTWSSGTSHSAPAVAGAAQLAYEYYGRVLDPGATPSPAMLKALLLNSPRYMNGSGAGGTLPSNSQGWGDLNLGQLFDGAVRQVVDQTVVFTNVGESVTYQWQVVDPTKPVRGTLVWTDAPGSTTGAAYVNNLDLEVTSGGQTYRGNVFSGSLSTTGGSFDAKNNVENVFLAAGTTGTVTAKVTAANLPGDGRPGQGDATDQDFALVVYNVANPLLRAVELGSVSWNDGLGNNNGVVDPGDRLSITVELHNTSGSQVQGINAVLSSTTPGIVLRQSNSKYSDIPAGSLRSNTTTFIADVGKSVPCGNNIDFQLNISANLGNGTLMLPGLGVGTLHQYSASGLPVDIPDPDYLNNPIHVYVPINIEDSFILNDLNVMINATHTWDADLSFSLISPADSRVDLIENRGWWGQDFQDTILDDEAAIPISNGTAPFSSSYQPEQSLSGLDGTNINGTWTLDVYDSNQLDIGRLTGFDLIASACNESWVTVTPDQALKAGDKGATIIYTLTITNTSSHPDTFNVVLTGADWNTVPSQNPINNLPPGGNTQLTVTVQIPTDPPARFDQVIVTLVSQSNSLSRQSAILTTGTGLLYLPLIRR